MRRLRPMWKLFEVAAGRAWRRPASRLTANISATSSGVNPARLGGSSMLCGKPLAWSPWLRWYWRLWICRSGSWPLQPRPFRAGADGRRRICGRWRPNPLRPARRPNPGAGQRRRNYLQRFGCPFGHRPRSLAEEDAAHHVHVVIDAVLHPVAVVLLQHPRAGVAQARRRSLPVARPSAYISEAAEWRESSVIDQWPMPSPLRDLSQPAVHIARA